MDTSDAQLVVATAEELTPLIDAWLRESPDSPFAGEDVEVDAPIDGSENMLWWIYGERIDGVVKLFPDAGLARGRRQFTAHQRFAPIGLAPRPLAFDRFPEGLPAPILLYEYVEGLPIFNLDVVSLDELAHVVSAIHMSDPAAPIPGSAPDEAVARFCPHPSMLQAWWQSEHATSNALQPWLASEPALLESCSGLYDAAQRLVAGALDLWQGAPLTLVHGDLSFDNIIHGPQGISLIDWEQSGLGDAAWDVAALLVGNPFEPEERRLKWLETYLSVTDLPNLRERILTYIGLYPWHSLNFLLSELRPATGMTSDWTETTYTELADFLGQLHMGAAAALHAPVADVTPLYRSLLVPPPAREVKT